MIIAFSNSSSSFRVSVDFLQCATQLSVVAKASIGPKASLQVGGHSLRRPNYIPWASTYLRRSPSNESSRIADTIISINRNRISMLFTATEINVQTNDRRCVGYNYITTHRHVHYLFLSFVWALLRRCWVINFDVMKQILREIKCDPR